MKIAELTRQLPVRIRSGSSGIEVREVTDDSRQVAPGTLFIARAGADGDGSKYIPDALARGAAAILCPSSVAVGPTDACVIEADPQDLQTITARLAEAFFGNPSQALRLIGITGTKGKTTTAWLVRHLLNESGVKCGLIGTVSIDDGVSIQPASLTTPGAIEGSRTLARMVAHGCRACVMEVSSHALHQGRVAGLRFAIGAFTNLTGDHLDYHGTMDAYGDAKAGLFRSLDPAALAVVNVDDPNAPMMLRECNAPVRRCGLSTSGVECSARVEAMDARETRLALRGAWGTFDACVPLIGMHNVSNILLAAAIAHGAGLGASQIQRALSTCTAPPGRLEPVTRPGEPLTVVVDYAHTDDALEKMLAAVRPITPPQSDLWVVFGCGGDRDRTKRPRMARVACHRADQVIITSDNPRTEDPNRIIEEILTGVPAGSSDRVCVMPDRRAAIHHVIEQARENDVVVIAGKGHEDYQIIGKTRAPFDDRLVAREALDLRFGRVLTT